MMPGIKVVGHIERYVVAQLMLDAEIRLLGIRKLEIVPRWKTEWQDRQRQARTEIVLIDEDGIRQQRVETLFVRKVAKTGWQTAEQPLKNICCIDIRNSRRRACARRRRPASPSELRRAAAVGDGRIERERQQRMTVKHPIAGADNGFAVISGIPRQADARRNIVGVARNALNDPQSILCFSRDFIHRRKDWCEFDVITHAVVQRQVRVQPPRILSEQTQRRIAERLVRVSDPLYEYLRHAQAVGLHRAEIRHGQSPKRRGQAESARRYFTKVVHAAELHHVRATRPQEIVGELIALFIAAYEAERLPSDKCKPRNIDSDITARRIR